MKNITAQYRDLQEGRLSKANFMTNVRREFPQWISSGNTFDDAVRILKSRRILNEGIHDKDITSASHTNVKTPPQGVGDYDPKAAADRLARLSKFGAKPEHDDEENTGGYDPELADMGRYVTEDDALEEDFIGGVNYDKDVAIEIKQVVGSLDKITPYVLELGDTVQSDSTGAVHVKEKGNLVKKFANVQDFLKGIRYGAERIAEAEKKEPTIDQVDYIQLQRGTEFEMSKMPVISDENYAKAKQKAYKNLVKDSNAYRHLSLANYKDVKKKDKALETQEVKKDNLADKANEQKTIVKNAKLNTKDTLGKQEKAKKGVPEGVKQLREAMLEEFQAVPEQKKTFAVGHEVKTPDGKAGRIADLTQDNTATVEFPDGTTGDYQTNVLKVNVPGEVFRRNVGNPRADLSKFTMDELKEKLIRSLEEAGEKTALVTTAGGSTTAIDYKTDNDLKGVIDNADIKSVVTGAGQKKK